MSIGSYNIANALNRIGDIIQIIPYMQYQFYFWEDVMKNVFKLWAAVGLVVALSAPSNSQSLIGHWEFEEGSGDIVGDSSGNGNNGTIFNFEDGGLDDGSVWFDDPERGSVASFGGAGDDAYVQIDNEIPVMTLEQDFTWAFWANDKADADSPNNIIFGNRRALNGEDFTPRQFIKFTPTKFEWHMNENGDDNLEYDDSEDPASNDIPNDVWMHHAVVKDGPVITYYRNGAAMNSAEITQPLDQPQPLFIGGDNTATDGEQWRGLIDDVRIYDSALSASEVAALAGAQSSNVTQYDLYQ